MCILFLAINQHPNHPLIICANRDEFYDRPTLGAHFWPEQKHILAGRDLQAGGSWLGINTQGHFAAITNIRTGTKQPTTKKSRGELVTLSLEPNSIVDVNWLVKHSDKYNPFNLIYGPLTELNCFNSLLKQQAKLTTGFHAISNGALDDIWPKMAKGEQRLEQVVSANRTINNDELFAILKDKTQADDSQLPDTGIPLDWERKLSSIFINSPEYGTRSSSVIRQNEIGTVEFVEQTYNANGEKGESTSFTLSKSIKSL
ncbi:MAG: NRDE family protein [Kangiellaceae bacterium]|nr:NRDE family protein [Kangiellaceae bacterium]